MVAQKYKHIDRLLNVVDKLHVEQSARYELCEKSLVVRYLDCESMFSLLTTKENIVVAEVGQGNLHGPDNYQSVQKSCLLPSC